MSVTNNRHIKYLNKSNKQFPYTGSLYQIFKKHIDKFLDKTQTDQRQGQTIQF